MKVVLIGVRSLDFQADTGEQVKGTQFFIAHPETGVTGQMTDKIFVKPEIPIPKGIEVGKPFQVFFNKRGKVESIALA